jgi:hypothetical protein
MLNSDRLGRCGGEKDTEVRDVKLRSLVCSGLASELPSTGACSVNSRDTDAPSREYIAQQVMRCYKEVDPRKGVKVGEPTPIPPARPTAPAMRTAVYEAIDDPRLDQVSAVAVCDRPGV